MTCGICDISQKINKKKICIDLVTSLISQIGLKVIVTHGICDISQKI